MRYAGLGWGGRGRLQVNDSSRPERKQENILHHHHQPGWLQTSDQINDISASLNTQSVLLCTSPRLAEIESSQVTAVRQGAFTGSRLVLVPETDREYLGLYGARCHLESAWSWLGS